MSLIFKALEARSLCMYKNNALRVCSCFLDFQATDQSASNSTMISGVLLTNVRINFSTFAHEGDRQISIHTVEKLLLQ